jgi:hypothetical protein
MMDAVYMGISDSAKTHTIETVLPAVLGCAIKGIPGIMEAVTTRSTRWVNGWEAKPEIQISTTGGNLFDILNHNVVDEGNIDFTQFYCNDIKMIENVYGIEAARCFIIASLVKIEGAPAYRHLATYADAMTWSGKGVAVDKLSNKEKNKTLLQAGAYSAGKTLSKAALMGVVDTVDGSISSQILLGSVPKIGTHYFECMVNEAFVAKYTKSTLEVLKEVI